jgi:hypothetical protein
MMTQVARSSSRSGLPSLLLGGERFDQQEQGAGRNDHCLEELLQETEAANVSCGGHAGKLTSRTSTSSSESWLMMHLWMRPVLPNLGLIKFCRLMPQF